MSEFDTVLLSELGTDPESIGYDALGWSASPPSEAQYQAIADSLNDDTARSIAIDNSPQALISAIRRQDWPVSTTGLPADEAAVQAQRDYIMALCSMDPVPLSDGEVQRNLTGGAESIWGSGAALTKAAIEDLWDGATSRGREIGLRRRVKVGDLRRLKGDVI